MAVRRRTRSSYFTVAEGSGGQVFLSIRQKVGESSALMIGAMKHEETVYRAAGTVPRVSTSFDPGGFGDRERDVLESRCSAPAGG